MSEIFYNGFREEKYVLTPLFSGREECAPSHRYGPNVRQCYLIHYVESGKGRFWTEDKEYELKKGWMFLISPGELTTYEADENDPWVYKWIGFECDFDISDIFCKNVVFSERCEEMFDKILESVKYGENAELFSAGKICEILALLRYKISSPHKREQNYAQKAKSYIEANYYKDITVEGIADEMGLDRSYLSSVFKEQIGVSPKEYIVNFRLANAAELMTSYDFSPMQAAASCGYPDIFNFSKMFKKKYGISPREYKRNFEGKQ